VYPYCRFPEELNGGRCFGDSLVDVLRGYGYDVETLGEAIAKMKSSPNKEDDTGEGLCRCAVENYRPFISSVSRYGWS
jgi:hypothetical protein